MTPHPARAALTLVALALAVASVLSGTAYGAPAGDRRLPPAVDVPNPLRGQYSWMGQQAQGGVQVRDLYERDRVYWGRINPAPGVYDFTWIDEGLAAAAAQGGQFGFRVMAWCPGCWMTYRDDWPDVTPADLPRQPGTDIPDWNDPRFQARWAELVGELARRYASDPRLGWLDVGGYGAYGEQWVTEGDRISSANWLRLVRTVAEAFPRQHVLVNTMTDPDWTLAALRRHPNLGMRTDCLGAPDMHSMLAVDPRLQGFWRTRPFFSEWCHSPETSIPEGLRQVRRFHVSTVSSGNLPIDYAAMSRAEQRAFRQVSAVAGYRYSVQVRTSRSGRLLLTWTNSGTAPTYDRWRTRIVVRRGGRVVARANAGDLRRVLPGARTVVTAVRPGRGRYDVTVRVTRPGVPAMGLAQTGRAAAGGYRLGRVHVR